MFYNILMDGLSRLKLLTSQMHLEPSEDANCFKSKCNKQDSVFISDAIKPNGARIKLLKTLLTSVCERNCNYCPFRAGRDFRRATFTPDEFARLFVYLHKARIADGIFLSSGIINGSLYTQDKLIATTEILRKKYQFNGYIHLKIMPGAEKAQVEQAMLLADRVSINLEAPNTERLHLLAPHKVFFRELLQPLEWVKEIIQTEPGHLAWNGYWPSSVTQFVVGAVGDTDLELLSTSQSLFRQLKINRAYYSAFSPIQDTPLENHEPTSQLREHRLYEASFLLRDYGFNVEEFEYDPFGNLPIQVDPKLLWAQQNLTHPIEINLADQLQLLRIPGIGKKGASAIISSRRGDPIRCLSQLSYMGINVNRAAPFILLNGLRPPQQLSFGI
jgi:predicted DNA-binding helix-hairpin-helix protein